MTAPPTLAEIEAAIVHDEAALAGYRSSLAKREAKGGTMRPRPASWCAPWSGASPC
jgi:hypothetical protein